MGVVKVVASKARRAFTNSTHTHQYRSIQYIFRFPPLFIYHKPHTHVHTGTFAIEGIHRRLCLQALRPVPRLAAGSEAFPASPMAFFAPTALLPSLAPSKHQYTKHPHTSTSTARTHALLSETVLAKRKQRTQPRPNRCKVHSFFLPSPSTSLPSLPPLTQQHR